MDSSIWIDNHTHLNMLKKLSPKEAIEEARKVGIKKFINIGTDSKDHPIVLSLAEKHKEVYCTLGVHPHDAEDYENAKGFMIKNLVHPKVVAVGEIGLDFHYDNAPRDIQEDVFKQQLDIATSLGLPVQIHTRSAEEKTIEILENYRGRIKGVLHCFSGSRTLAEIGVGLGLNFSISGVITFKNAEDLRQTIKEVVPLERIHIETDAPFLAPMPHRGKENHPALMIETAKAVADLKGVGLEDLKNQAYQNSMNLFPKLANTIEY